MRAEFQPSGTGDAPVTEVVVVLRRVHEAIDNGRKAPLLRSVGPGPLSVVIGLATEDMPIESGYGPFVRLPFTGFGLPEALHVLLRRRDSADETARVRGGGGVSTPSGYRREAGGGR